MTRGRLSALSILFFISGAAALLFETLWFRLAGLTFGNAAWASATVLASFMAGLALGNLLSMRFRGSPLRVYTLLECGVGISGAVLVLLLPVSTTLIAPLFRALGEHSALIALTRLTLAFLLMLIPTSLMGATLPTLVRSMESEKFERALALLYGWNTLGAVCGALAGEMLLIEKFGLRGTALVAGSCSLLAAAGAWVLARSSSFSPPGRGEGARSADEGCAPSREEGAPSSAFGTFSPASRGRRNIPKTLLIATAIAGFTLLALEVTWMRLLILFFSATSLAFAVMLAVILLGIGLGSLISGVIARRFDDADRWAAPIAALASVALLVCYRWFPADKMVHEQIFTGSICLMLPVSVLSGMLFPWIGKQIERRAGEGTLATAALTSANTLGGMAGSIIATFVLIPHLGVDGAMLLCAVAYVVIALLVEAGIVLRSVSIAVAIASIALAPSDLLYRRFIPIATKQYHAPNTSIVAIQQGPTETAIYLETRAWGAPYSERLVTNGHSMAGSSIASKRYMSLFVHLPIAVKPQTRSALLISYGVGITAHALTSTPQLQSIDIVDISKNILSLADIVWPGASNPLLDPRVRVHVEDGRFFLMTTPRKFDLITAEPPPPKRAGVVNLYTQEYFALLRDRLNEGGLATYWLPVYLLEPNEARSIARAFCSELDDCTMWSGLGPEWILMGSRGPMPVVRSFAAPWQTPSTADWLSRIGLDRPEMLGSLFLADTAHLKRWAWGAPPLTDDFPLRLSPRPLAENASVWSSSLNFGAREREFMASPRFSEEVHRSAAPYFGITELTDKLRLDPSNQLSSDPKFAAAILTRSSLRDAPRLLIGSDRWLEDLAAAAWKRGDRDPAAAYVLGIGALCDRRYAEASMLFETVPNHPRARSLAQLARTLEASVH